MDLDLRRLVDMHHSVVVEVALLDTPLCDGDLAVEGSRQPENESPFDLSRNGIRIYDGPTIDGADDAPEVDLAAPIHLDFRYRRDVGSEHALNGDTASDAAGQSASPT